jgi:hypothetical protein
MSKHVPLLDESRARSRFSAVGFLALLLALCAPGAATAASWTDARPSASWTDARRPAASWTDVRPAASWTDRAALKARASAAHQR